MYRQLTQVLAAARLISRAQGASIAEIASSVGISIRTVHRLRRNLEDLGYILYTEPDGREVRYHLNQKLDSMSWWIPLPKIIFNFEDRVLIDYLFQKASENPTISEIIRTLRKKLDLLIADGGYSVTQKEDGAGDSLKKNPVLLHTAPVGKQISAEQNVIINTLLQSIKEKSMCTVSYDSSGEGIIKTYKIHPLVIFENDGGLYAFVFQPYHGKVITLAIERMRALELSEESFVWPEGFDVEKRLSDPFGIVQLEKPFLAKIKFVKHQARYIQERDWPEGTKIEVIIDGSIILNIETAGAFKLKRWIQSFGSSVEVLEPQWLRDDILKDLHETLKVYQ